jgi:hypothetical protein
LSLTSTDMFPLQALSYVFPLLTLPQSQTFFCHFIGGENVGTRATSTRPRCGTLSCALGAIVLARLVYSRTLHVRPLRLNWARRVFFRSPVLTRNINAHYIKPVCMHASLLLTYIPVRCYASRRSPGISGACYEPSRSPNDIFSRACGPIRHANEVFLSAQYTSPIVAHVDIFRTLAPIVAQERASALHISRKTLYIVSPTHISRVVAPIVAHERALAVHVSRMTLFIVSPT